MEQRFASLPGLIINTSFLNVIEFDGATLGLNASVAPGKKLQAIGMQMLSVMVLKGIALMFLWAHIDLLHAELDSVSKAGKIATETKPKYSLITSHTARRSFATNAYKDGVPTIAIMKITGHRSVIFFLNYIKIGKEENAEQLASHPFFK